MWTAIAAGLSWLLNWLFNRKKSEQQQTVETANEASKVSAEISRNTEQVTRNEITESRQADAAAVAAVHAADSLRAKNRIAADAVNRANRKL